MTTEFIAPAVLEPATTAEVRAIIADAHDAQAPLRIEGAGTWRDAGAPCEATQVLSLRALSGVIEYVPGDLTLTAWAGTTMAELSHATAAHGQWLGLDPAGDRRGTIGATVATASSGPLAHAFGTPRDLVLGMECVTGYGEVVRPGGRVVKNVAGFDLVRLNTGAWGTLGAITAVTLRLRALPVHDVTLAIPVDDAAHLARLIPALRAPTIAALAMELLDGETASAFGLGDGADVILVRLGGNDAFVRGQQAAIASVASCTVHPASVWGLLAGRDSNAPLVVRISGSVSGLRDRIARLRTARRKAGAAGGLHASLGRGIVRVVADEAPPSLCDAITVEVTGEQCIIERQPVYRWAMTADPFSAGLAGRVRAAFDPMHICNRRRVTHA